MDGVTPGMTVGASTEALAGEDLSSQPEVSTVIFTLSAHSRLIVRCMQVLPL